MNLLLHQVSIAFLFLCFLITLTNSSNNPTPHSKGDDVSINCGSTGTFTARNGRKWVGDVKHNSLLQIHGSSTLKNNKKLISADPVPYKTARVSPSQFSYAFQVSPGHKILRLHFTPSPYQGLKDLFTVEAGPFTLLANFSASLTANALRVNSFTKEFCLNIQEHEQFDVTFSPESSSSLDTYAFINGIEIISVPTDFTFYQGGDIGVQVVGQNSLVYVDHHTALELVHRLNIKHVSVQSSGDFDDTFPMWALRKRDKVKNNTWKIAVDVGFRYMIRLHFSEMGLKIAGSDDVVFKVLINEILAQTNIDLVKNRDDVSYQDYMVMMRGRKKEGKRDILLSLESYDDVQGLLAGFEIFKLSNPDNSLASANPLPLPQGSQSKTLLILFSIFRHRNAFAFVEIAMISLVSIVVHKLREHSEANSTEENKPPARDKINKGEVDKNVASSLREEMSPASLKTFAGTAERCMRDDPKNRPQLELAHEQHDNKQVLVVTETASASDDIRPSISDERDLVSTGQSPVLVSTGQSPVASTHAPYLTSPPEEQTNSQAFNDVLPSARRATSRKPLRLWPWDSIWKRIKPSKKNDTQSEISDGVSSRISSLDGGCRHFTLHEIRLGTDDFSESHLIGVGRFGKVYKGLIDGKTTTVAIKRANTSPEQYVQEFLNEIDLLSKLSHRHLVSLIGVCEENDETTLVYEYMANGTLREHLYKTKNNHPPLSWDQRLGICIDAARAIHYLHTGANPMIIHEDVNSTNILLDEKWVAKISGFGHAKTGHNSSQTHVSMVIRGTSGYRDPEYIRRQQSTDKSDVYSFGVVLFEVLCGRPAVNFNLPKGQVMLADWAILNCNRNSLKEIIDPCIGNEIRPECLKQFVKTAVKCLSDRGVNRPSMGDVLWDLEFCLQLQQQ